MHNLTQPTIFIVVLNYNGQDTILDCLSSVYQSDYPKFEVVVVDNDSKDGSFEMAKKQFSRAHFIKNSNNTGYAAGNNIGIRFALEKFADYVLVLNNDAFLKKNTLTELCKLAHSNKKYSVLNPLILNRNETSIWFAGGIIQWPSMKTEHRTEVEAEKPYLTEYCTGCALFVNKDVFKKIGLFDERYFLYYEDADFSMRAKKAGFDLYVCPSIKIYHLEQSTTKNDLKTYWLVLSGLLFFSSHADLFQKIWLFIYLRLRKIKNLYSITFTSSTQAAQVRKAYLDFKHINWRQ